MWRARWSADRVAQGLDRESLFKGRTGVDALANPLQQVMDRVGERVLVANDVSGRPPVRGVWVHALGDVDGTEPLQAGRVILEIDLQFVHALEVEGDRSFRSVDLEAIEVAPPRRQTRRLERATGPALEARQEGRRVIDRDLAHLRAGLGRQPRAAAGVRRHRALLDEG